MEIEQLFNYALIFLGVLGFTVISLILISLIIFLIKAIIGIIKL
jgi:hypothetical protein